MLGKQEVVRLKELCRGEIAAKLRESGNVSVGEQEMEDIISRAVGTVTLGYPGVLDDERAQLSRALSDDFLRLGPLQPLFEDPAVTEIMVNGGGYEDDGTAKPATVWVVRAGRIEERKDISFDNEQHVRRIQAKIVADVGRQLNEESPYVDARLQDGSRVNCTIPPISIDGPTINIRRFRRDMVRAQDFADNGTLTQDMLSFLKACVQARLNIVVCGGADSGKTTMLNVLSGFIPSSERVITIEDSAELQIKHRNKVRMEARPRNSEGKGEVTIHDLLVNALRQRPDRIIIGECRHSEAWEMIQAMQTGHDGSLTTLHANDPSNALARIESMVAETPGLQMSESSIRAQIAAAVDIVVHTERNVREGSRRVMSIVAVPGDMEDGNITRSELFAFTGRGVDVDGSVMGSFAPKGMQPPAAIRNKIIASGAEYDPMWFFEN